MSIFNDERNARVNKARQTYQMYKNGVKNTYLDEEEERSRRLERELSAMRAQNYEKQMNQNMAANKPDHVKQAEADYAKVNDQAKGLMYAYNQKFKPGQEKTNADAANMADIISQKSGLKGNDLNKQLHNVEDISKYNTKALYEGYKTLNDTEKLDYAKSKLMGLSEDEQSFLKQYGKYYSDVNKAIFDPVKVTGGNTVMERLKNAFTKDGDIDSIQDYFRASAQAQKAFGWTPEQTKQYFDLAKRVQNDEDQKALNQTAAINQSDNKLLRGVQNTVAAVMNPQAQMSTLGAMPQYFNKNLGYDTNSPWNRAFNYKNELQNQVNQNAIGDDHKVGQFLYNAGMATVDSAEQIAMFNGLGKFGSLIPFFSGAATQTYSDAKQRGLDDRRASQLGIASGAIEALTELVPLDHFYKMANKAGMKLGKEALREWIKQVGEEAIEEGSSDLLNRFADYMIAGDDRMNSMSIAIDDYMKQGKTEQEAKSLAERDFWTEFWLDALAGGISGGIMGGVGVGIGTAKSKARNNQISEAANKNAASIEVETDYDKNRKAQSEKYANNPTRYLADRINDSTAEGKEIKAKLMEVADKEASGKKLTVNDHYIINEAMSEVAEKKLDKNPLNDNSYVPKEYREATTGINENEFRANVIDAINNQDFEKLSNSYAAAKNSTSADLRQNVDAVMDQFKGKALNSGLTEEQWESAKTSSQDAYIEGLNGNEVQNLSSRAQEAYNAGKEARIKMDADLVNALANTKDTEGAQTAYKAYRDENVSIMQYDKLFDSAYNAGAVGLSYDEVDESAKSVLGDNAKAIYEAGVNDYVADAEKENVSLINKALKVGKKGTGTFNDLRTNKNSDVNTDLMRVVAKVTGLDIRLTNARADGVQASFTSGDSTIEVTEDHAAQLIHELGEFASFYASEEYEKVRKAAMGAANEILGTEQFNRILNRYHEVYKGIHKGQTVFDSSSELANDYLVSLMNTEKGQSALADYLAKNYEAEEAKTLGDKIKEMFKNIIDSMKSLLSGSKLNSAQRTFLNNEIKANEKNIELFINALDKAIENYNSLKVLDRNSPEFEAKVNEIVNKAGVGYDAATESAYSYDTFMDSDYVKNREESINALSIALEVSKEQAAAYIDDINSIANIIASDKTKYDYDADPFNSSVVSNAEYGASIDFSTICKKRLLYTGTLQEIQKQIGNRVITMQDYLDIRNAMLEDGLQTTCGCCYVEGSRVKLGQFMKEFIKRYSADNPKYVPTMYEVTMPDGIRQLRAQHPEVWEAREYFLNHMGQIEGHVGEKNLFGSQGKPKDYTERTEYRGELLDMFLNKKEKVDEKNKNGGLRLQSFSDFEIVNLIDCMQVIMDMSRCGLAGQAYTKVYEFADALGNTGLKINLSLMGAGVDENGDLILDEVNGMKKEEAIKLRNKYSKNVGTIIVAFTDEQIKAAMRSDYIDYIIPFHRSQWRKTQYAALGLPEGTKDYTLHQNDRVIKENGRLKKADKNHMPNEYWDFSKTGRENAEHYINMCNEEGKVPKFPFLLDKDSNGKYYLPEGADGYYKLLIDFKMYDNDGVGSPQMPVKPNFSMDECKKMLENYTGGHESFPSDKKIAKQFADKIIAREKEFSLDVDSDGNQLTENQAKYFKDSAIRDENGNLKVMYHGTKESFTIFDPLKLGGLNGTAEGYGLYFADNPEVSKAYGNNVMKGYLNITKPARFDQKNIKQNDLAKLIKATCEKEAQSLMEDGYDSIKDAIKDTWISNYVDTYGMSIDQAYREVAKNILNMNDNDMHVVQEVMAGMAIRSYASAYEFYDTLTDTLGIDGFIAEWEDTNTGDKTEVAVALYSKQFKNIDNQNPTSDPDIRYSVDIIEAEKKLGEQIDNWLKGEMPKDHLFNFGKTPQVLKSLGAEDLDIVLPEDRILKFTTDYNDHPVSLDEVRRIPSEIADPIMILPGTVNGKLLKNAYAIITELEDKKGNDVMVAIHLSKTENHYKVNRIATIFGKNNYHNYLKSIIEVLKENNIAIPYADKKRATSWTTSDRVQFPSLVQYIDAAPNIKIPDSEKKSNYKYSLDIGYHAGDLGKAEPLSSQGLGRDTGHFGTGTYFVGNEADINIGNYETRPHEVVDFSKYNLFKPKTEKEGFKLHDFLRGVDGFYDMPEDSFKSEDEWEAARDALENGLDPWDEDDKMLPEVVYESAKRLFGGQQVNKAIVHVLDGNYGYDEKSIVEYDDNYHEVRELSAEDIVSIEGFEDAIYDVLRDNRYAPRWLWRYEEWIDSFEDISEMLGVSTLEMNNIITDIAGEIDGVGYEESKTHDSAATMFMKKLGYEGIDVRGFKGLDNTGYGSVIYDLKGEDLERKIANGARFSLDVDTPLDLAANIYDLAFSLDDYGTLDAVDYDSQSEIDAIANDIANGKTEYWINTLEDIIYEDGENEEAKRLLNALNRFTDGRRYSLNLDEDEFALFESDNPTISDKTILEEGLKALKGKNVDTKTINTIAAKLKNEFASTIDKKTFADMLTRAFGYLHNQDNIRFNDVMALFEEVSKPVIDQATKVENAELYNDFVGYLRGKKIRLTQKQLADVRSVYGSYEDFKKTMHPLQFSINGDTSLEGIWTELAEAYPGLVEYGVSEADMPFKLDDILQSLRPSPTNTFGADAEEVGKDLAMRIVEEYLGMQSDARLKKAADQLKVAEKEYRAKVRERYNEKLARAKKELGYDAIWHEAERKQKYQQKLERDRKEIEYNERWKTAELRQKDQQRFDAQMEDMQHKVDEARYNERWKAAENAKRIAEVKAKSKDRMTAYRDKQNAKEQKKQIAKITKDLITRITDPSEKKHVPSALVEPLTQFLQCLDFVEPDVRYDEKSGNYYIIDYTEKTPSGYGRIVGKSPTEVITKFTDKLNAGKGTNSQLLWQNRLNGLQKIFAKSANMEEEMEDILNLLDATMADALEEVLENNKYTLSINNMSTKDLVVIKNALRSISHAINQQNKAFTSKQNISDVAHGIQENADKLKRKDHTRLFNTLHDTLIMNMMTPETYFTLLGKEGRDIYTSFQRALEKKIGYVHQTEDFMKNTLDGVDAREVRNWRKDIKTFTTSEGDIKMSVAHIMSLYELSKRQQAMLHMPGGIEVDRITEGFKKVELNQNRGIHLSETELQQIFATLTDDQIRIADAMQQYMANVCGGWGNEASMLMYDYEKFLDPNYFPITVDSDTNVSKNEDGMVNLLNGIERMGFTKAVNKNAKNPIVVKDIFSVFTEHSANMAAYAAYAPTIKDALRVYNFKDIQMDGDNRNYLPIKKALDACMGRTDKSGQMYFEKLIRDINGTERANKIKNIGEQFVGMYKAAAVGFNVRVVVQQPTAYIRAATLIKPQYLMEAMPKAFVHDMEKLRNENELIYWKSKGYYEVSLGKNIENIVLGSDSVRDKLTDASMWLAGKADDMTWACLDDAVRRQIKAENPGISQEEFDAKVKELFSDVIHETQVVDSTVMKSPWQRSKDGKDNLLTSFMAEPIKSYNIMMKALIQAERGEIAKKTAIYAGGVLIATDMVNAMAQALVDAIRYRDDEEEYGEQVLEYWYTNFKDNVNPIKRIPFLKDVWDQLALVASGESSYGQTSGQLYEYAALNSITQALGTMKKQIDGTYKKTNYAAYMDYAKALSQITGIPAYNFSRDAVAAWNMVVDDELKLIKQEEKATDKYKQIISVLDNEKTDEDLNNAVKKALEKEGTVRGIESQIKSAFRQDYLDAIDNQDDKLEEELFDKAVRGYMALGMNRVEAEKEVEAWTDVTIGYSDLDKAIESGDGIQLATKVVMDAKDTDKILDHIYNYYGATIELNRARGYESEVEQNVNEALRYIDGSNYDSLARMEEAKEADRLARQAATEARNAIKEKLYDSIDNGVDYKTTINDAFNDGIEMKTLKSAITDEYKDKFIAAYKAGDYATATSYRNRIAAVKAYCDQMSGLKIPKKYGGDYYTYELAQIEEWLKD